MIYIIAALFVLSVLHFAYEMIVAPSLRCSVRHRLFALRDQLRKLKMTPGNQLDDRHFAYLQDSLNALIRTLDGFNLSLLVRLRTLSGQDAAFRARVEERSRVLDDCVVPEALDVRRKSVQIALEAFAINCGGGLIYLAPLLFAFNSCSRVKPLVRALASVPDSDLSRIAQGAPRMRVADA
jgi:hypothetical protein